jgi:hypothetical protein
MIGAEQRAQRGLHARRGGAVIASAHQRVYATLGALQVANQQLHAKESGGAGEQNAPGGRSRCLPLDATISLRAAVGAIYGTPVGMVHLLSAPGHKPRQLLGCIWINVHSRAQR